MLGQDCKPEMVRVTQPVYKFCVHIGTNDGICGLQNCGNVKMKGNSGDSPAFTQENRINMPRISLREVSVLFSLSVVKKIPWSHDLCQHPVPLLIVFCGQVFFFALI